MHKVFWIINENLEEIKRALSPKSLAFWIQVISALIGVIIAFVAVIIAFVQLNTAITTLAISNRPYLFIDIIQYPKMLKTNTDTHVYGLQSKIVNLGNTPALDIEVKSYIDDGYGKRPSIEEFYKLPQKLFFPRKEAKLPPYNPSISPHPRLIKINMVISYNAIESITPHRCWASFALRYNPVYDIDNVLKDIELTKVEFYWDKNKNWKVPDPKNL